MKKTTKTTSKRKQQNQPVSPPQVSFKLNAFNVTLLVIGSFLVTVLLYIGLLWLIDYSDTYETTTYNTYESSSYDSEDTAFLLIILGLILGPGIIAAAIAVFMIKKRKN